VTQDAQWYAHQVQKAKFFEAVGSTIKTHMGGAMFSDQGKVLELIEAILYVKDLHPQLSNIDLITALRACVSNQVWTWLQNLMSEWHPTADIEHPQVLSYILMQFSQRFMNQEHRETIETELTSARIGKNESFNEFYERIELAYQRYCQIQGKTIQDELSFRLHLKHGLAGRDDLLDAFQIHSSRISTGRLPELRKELVAVDTNYRRRHPPGGTNVRSEASHQSATVLNPSNDKPRSSYKATKPPPLTGSNATSVASQGSHRADSPEPGKTGRSWCAKHRRFVRHKTEDCTLQDPRTEQVRLISTLGPEPDSSKSTLAAYLLCEGIRAEALLDTQSSCNIINPKLFPVASEIPRKETYVVFENIGYSKPMRLARCTLVFQDTANAPT
jgi:hypothetical protein